MGLDCFHNPGKDCHARRAGCSIVRNQHALLLSIVAILLYVAAGASLAGASEQAVGHPSSQPVNVTEELRLRVWWQVIGWGVLLILTLVVSAIAIILFSRRIKTYLVRGKQRPTHAEDVWSMHTLSDDLDTGQSNQSSPDEDD